MKKYRFCFVLILISLFIGSCKKKQSSENLTNEIKNDFSEVANNENPSEIDSSAKDEYVFIETEDYPDLDFESPYSDFEKEDFDTDNTLLYSDTEISSEVRLIDSNNRLMQLKFEDEIFIPEEKKDSTVLINSAGEKVTRSYYDSTFRLSKKETWKIPDVKNAELIKTEMFSYADSGFVEQKIIKQKNQSVKTYYNENGLPLKTEITGLFSEKNAEGENSEETEYRISSSSWTYDSSNRIKTEEIVSCEYAEKSYKKPLSVFSKKQEYSYHSDEKINPDYFYYENGKLRMKTIYQNNLNYQTYFFFDSGYTVQAIYKNGQKIKEIYALNGKAIRTVNYE